MKYVNDLITEHGSSVVLKQHLEFLRDRLKLSEQDRTDLVKRLRDTEAELTTARETVAQISATIRRLKDDGAPELTKGEVAILRYCAERADKGGLSIPRMGAALSLSPAQTKLYVERLAGLEMIYWHPMDETPRTKIEGKGLAYLESLGEV